MLLVVFGYAARFDVASIPTAVVGPNARDMAGQLPEVFTVDLVDPTLGEGEVTTMLRDSEVKVAFVTSQQTVLLVDGTELFVAQSALRRVPSG
ncbi:MAG: hypothetical protein R2710_03030 [Acidimicrobiales bacterium]